MWTARRTVCPILQFHVDKLTGDQRDRCRVLRTRPEPMVDDLGAADPQNCAADNIDDQLMVSGLPREQLARPSGAEFVGRDAGGGSGPLPVEINNRIEPGMWYAGEILGTVIRGP